MTRLTLNPELVAAQYKSYCVFARRQKTILKSTHNLNGIKRKLVKHLSIQIQLKCHVTTLF